MKIACILFLAFLVGCAQPFKDTSGREWPFRIEVYSIKTPSPTVIIAHGSDCFETSNAPYYRDWARRINGWGYNAVIIDHCTLRGVRSGDSGGIMHPGVEPEARSRDIHALAEWIHKQPFHVGRAGYVGFSHGGVAAIRANGYVNSLDPSSGHLDPNGNISAYVSYYPACVMARFPENPRSPLLLLLAELDDTAPPNRCLSYPKNPLYSHVLYEGVHHCFDGDGVNMLVYRKSGMPWTCRYDTVASKDSRNRVKDFLEKHVRSTK
jgi:dienelactone hydrolase